MQNKQAMYALALGLLGLMTTNDAVCSPQVAQASSPVAPVRAASVAANVITSVSVTAAGEATKITVVGTQPFTPDVRSLLRPSATVITIAGKWNAGRTGYTSVRKNNVFNVRAGRFSDNPSPSVRIVANTRGVLTHAVRAVSSDNTQWEILVGNAQSVRTASALAKTMLAVREPAASPVTLTPSSEFAPKVSAKPSTGANVFVNNIPPVPSDNLRLAADLTRPTVAPSAPKNGPYPALLRTPAALRTPPAPAAIPAPVLFAVPEPRAAALAPAARLAPAERRVSLDFVGADIVDVLKALSMQSGLNVVAGSDVKGSVTVALKAVPMIEALDMVTRLSGFRYAKVGTTYVVGTSASVAALSRSSSQGQAISAPIPFFYSDGATLEKSIMQAFPSANVSRVDAGADAKKDGAVTSDSYPTTSSRGDASSISGSSANINKETAKRGDDERLKPRGGIFNVVGTQEEVAAVRTFVEATEEAFVSASRRQVEAEGEVLAALRTEKYQLKYASPSGLVEILRRLVPNVRVLAGPTQAFQPATLNGSASFSSSPSTPSVGAAAAGSGTGGNSGTATTGSSVFASGPVAPSLLPPTLILTGTPPDLVRARQILEENDTRSPQMQYEAKVVDINALDAKKLGLRYDLSRAINIGEPNLKAPGGIPSVGATYSDDLRKPNFGTIFRSPYSINVALDALENDNKARVLARPNLSALDGQSATVFIGDQIKYVINIQNTPTGQNIQTETATVGITLKVTGKSSPDGTITLYVHPEVSSISSYISLSNGISLPQIATRFVDTTIRVKDGETIGIGGLIRDDDITNIQKVPLLGDIPFFGQLFRSKDARKSRSEVIVFITSRILKD